MTDQAKTLGIMTISASGQLPQALPQLTKRATRIFTDALPSEISLDVNAFTYHGNSLTPGNHGYRALDFVQVGINEKTERRLAFLLIVTEVEISAASFSYLLALPSQLTNVAIISTSRLLNDDADNGDENAKLPDRLATLMIHCFGRLLNLDYHKEDPENYLYPIRTPDELDPMTRFTAAQLKAITINLPREANDRFSTGNHLSFLLSQAVQNLPRIIRGALRAKPWRIATKLPTMIATALSVIIVLIFGGETWDFAASASAGQLSVFVVGSFLASSFVLYRAFTFRLVATRSGSTSESTVVTAGATFLALLLTLTILFLAFALLMYGVVVFVFPDELMSSWTSVKDGTAFEAHVRLVLFLASVGVLSGSLGGSADSRSVVRNVLFAADET